MDSNSLRPQGLNYLADNIERKDNILGVSKQEGARWARGLNLPRSAEVLFFAGCGYQYDSKLETLMGLIRKMDKSAMGTDLAIGVAGLQKKLGLDGIFLKALGGGKEDGQPLKDAIRILRKIGLNPGYLAEEEPCCAGLLHYMGAEREFTAHGQKMRQKLTTGDIKLVIGMVPSCTATLRNTLVVSTNISVKHFTQVLAQNISSLKLDFHRNAKVTYHDPCQLVRFMDISDEPRQILSAIRGVELVEPKWVKGQFATCCGGGGGFEAVFPEMSEMLAAKRARELVETGADIIVTQCPGCIMQLKTGLRAIQAAEVEVLDLAQIVATSMED
jgi:dimethylglycine catabolism B